MGEFAKWLLHDDQKELFEHLYITVLNILFLALVALLLWPLDKASLALRLAKGYWVFWIVLYWTALLLLLFRRIFRVEMDTHFDAYVISALVVSGILQAGWSAFAALTVRDFIAGTSVWVMLLLYLVGLLSSYIAFGIVSTLYGGSIYRTFNLPLALISFLFFSVWSASGRVLYGWFFDLCEKVWVWLW